MNLKPCPFCGGSALIDVTRKREYGISGLFYAACVGCWSQGSIEDTIFKAAKAWNCRVEKKVKEVAK